MAGSDPYDLRRFAPPRTTRFTLYNGSSYEVPGDIDVLDVCRLLVLEEAISEHQVGEEAANALTEATAELVALVRRCDPDLDETTFRISPQEVSIVFALILHGPSVAAAVQEAIVPPQELAVGAEGAESGVQTPQDGDPEAAVAPLPSRKRSSGASSGSDGETAGTLTTTTA